MKLHKILLSNEQRDDNSNNNKIPTPRDKGRQGWIVIFFGPDREWEGNWEIFCRNIKEFYWLTPPPRSHLPCYSNYKRSHLCSVILSLFFFFQVGCGAIGCELLKNFALLGIAGSANGMVVFIFILTFSDMFHHFDFWTVFVCSF